MWKGWLEFWFLSHQFYYALCSLITEKGETLVLPGVTLNANFRIVNLTMWLPNLKQTNYQRKSTILEQTLLDFNEIIPPLSLVEKFTGNGMFNNGRKQFAMTPFYALQLHWVIISMPLYFTVTKKVVTFLSNKFHTNWLHIWKIANTDQITLILDCTRTHSLCFLKLWK